MKTSDGYEIAIGDTLFYWSNPLNPFVVCEIDPEIWIRDKDGKLYARGCSYKDQMTAIAAYSDSLRMDLAELDERYKHLRQIKRMTEQGVKWFCPKCETDVENEHVTYQGLHDPRFGGCGESVE